MKENKKYVILLLLLLFSIMYACIRNTLAETYYGRDFVWVRSYIYYAYIYYQNIYKYVWIQNAERMTMKSSLDM